MARRYLLRVATWCLVPIILSGCTSGSQPPAADAFNGDEVGGCGDFFVYHTSANRRWRLTVTVDRTDLPDAAIPATLDLAKDSEFVHVEILRLGVGTDTDPCDCIGGGPPTDVWKAVSGTLTITTQRLEKPFAEENYKVSVTLDDVELKHPETGFRSTLDTVEINNVVVGWFAG